MVYMEATTTPKPERCYYCHGGYVYGGSPYAPYRRCLICKGTDAPSRIHAGVVVPATTTGYY